MEQQKRVLVTGAGGFIGHHMVRFLRQKGFWVRGADIKEPEYSSSDEADEFLLLDLRFLENCLRATEGIDEVYTFAANMGGMGFITTHDQEILYDNVCINANIAEACKQNGVKRVFYSSSACVYPTFKQGSPEVAALKESDAIPADPDNEYGWEKLFSERLYKSYGRFFEARIARFHNIYGPEGTYDGERAKAPASICRKVAIAENNGDIQIWGDGLQTRSFCYIDDCVEGVYKLMNSDFRDPLNIGSSELVSINAMVDIVSKIAGKTLVKKYQLDKPQGVRGRNSDNTLCREVLGWVPEVSLEEGLHKTYSWVKTKIG